MGVGGTEVGVTVGGGSVGAESVAGGVGGAVVGGGFVAVADAVTDVGITMVGGGADVGMDLQAAARMATRISTAI